MARIIKREVQGPHCQFARGYKIKIDTHASYKGLELDYSGRLGVVTFSTAIFKGKCLAFEQVTVDVVNGPTIILEILGRSGTDCIQYYKFCDHCGRSSRRCIC